jgi:hypothetical protein
MQAGVIVRAAAIAATPADSFKFFLFAVLIYFVIDHG